jgi:CBS domain-containing protein
MTTLASVCKFPVRTVTPATTVRAAAEIMREHHVGALVVVGGKNGAVAKPIGIVTDRDIVVAIVALDLNPNVFLIDDLIDRTLTVAKGDQHIREGLELMKKHGIRRLPLIDKQGKLIGIVTMEDLLAELAADLSRLSLVVENEITSELSLRPGKIRARQAQARQAAAA